MSRSALRPLAIALLTVFATSRADVIKLKNGKTIDGLVTKETDAAVTVNIGVGEVTLKRAQIVSIQKSDAAGRAALEKQWQRHYFTNQKYVPKGWEDIANDFSGLEQQRQLALKSIQQMRQLKADIAKNLSDLRSYQQEAVGVAAQVHDLPPPDELKTREDFDTYNKAVGRDNKLNSLMTLKQGAMRDAEDALQEAAKVPADYMQALDRFSAAYEKRLGETPPTTNFAAFFQEIDGRLKGFQNEWQRFDVPYEGSNNVTLVDVKLNDKVTGRFVLDTGASAVTLSRELAARLGLDTSGTAGVALIVADGRKVNAAPVMLKSVQLGDARAENVAAFVQDKEPAPGVDGLLGMTFLREFDLHIDATGHRIELTRLKTGED